MLRIITNIRLHPVGLHQAAQLGDGGLLHGFGEEPHFLEVGFGFEDGLFIKAPQAEQIMSIAKVCGMSVELTWRTFGKLLTDELFVVFLSLLCGLATGIPSTCSASISFI